MADGRGVGDIIELLTHPWMIPSALAGIVLLIYHAAIQNVLGSVLIAHSGAIFQAVSLSVLTLGQTWPPSTPGEWAVALAGVVFLGYLVDSVVDALETRVEDDTQ